jgi:hypothetical protein
VPLKKFAILLSLLLTLTLLHGCGGGGGGASGTASVRLVNGTANSLDLVSAGNVLASGIAYGTASSYTPSATGIFTLNNTGNGIPSAQSSLYLAGGVNYTVLAYTSGQSLHMTSFTDNEVAPTTGYGKLRIIDLSTDAGSVDVYMAVQENTQEVYDPSTASAALAAASVLVHSLNGNGTAGYFQIPKATYHIWITGAGDIKDLRLNIPNILISDQQVLTLVLTGTTSGALLDGLLISQQGAVVGQKNINARVRLAAGTTDSIATATVNNAVALSNNTIPLIPSSTSLNYMVGSYVLIPSGNLTANVNSGTCAGISATAGEDLTLLVTGSSGSPVCSPIVDDNTRPVGGKAKLRSVNGVNGGSGYSLVYDNLTIVPNVPFGTASSAIDGIVYSGFHTITVPSSSVTLPTTLQSQGVYSVFMLGPNPASATGILTLDN